ncbi:MAG TPA: hypothetical protein ENK11_04910, partial [Phycisphaerales bacterium]|nr:hypothetical protein [Phycisphaerales bacterium]
MKATARKSEPVHPSSRDPVGGWLDVFIPMLGLPRDRAEEIRAELEDHLRARVDDLMITGKSETEATQQAVAELGETAELARDFRSALKPRRRMLMQTALITAVGASVFFGILTFTGAPPAPPHAPAPAVAGERVELEDALASDFIPDITINTRNMTYADLFNTMRENMDRPFLVHWDRLRPVGMSPEGTLGLGGDELPLRRVLMLLEERTQFNNGDQIAFLL